jgi:hypothetical protein
MNLQPEIPPPSPLHTPRAQPLWPLAGANGGETSSRPRSPPPRAVALRFGPRCPCTLASRCALQRWAGEWRVARAQESQSFRAAEAGGRGGASRGRVANLAAGASYFLDSWAAEQPSSRAAEQPSKSSSPNFLHAALQPISPGRSASSRTNEGMQAAGAGPPCCSSPGHKGPQGAND